MSWYYRRRFVIRNDWLMAVMVLGAIAWFFVAVTLDFVPFPGLTDGVILVVGGVVGMVGWVLALSRAPVVRAKGWGGINSPVLVIFMLAVGLVLSYFLTWLIWLMVVKSTGFAITSAFGENFFRELTVVTREHCRRSACRYEFEQGISPRAIFSDGIAIESALYDAFPEQQIRILVFGRQSFMGTRIDSVRFVEPPAAHAP